MATTTTTTNIQPGVYGYPLKLKKLRQLRGGKWTPPASGEYFDNVT